MSAVRLEVLFFAAAREAVGAASVRLALPAATTVDALATALRARYPGLAAVGAVRFAVGERFADGATVLSDGDVVALIPPVSGG